MLTSFPRRLVIPILFLIFIPPAAAHAADELSARIAELTHRPEYLHGRWGLLVVDAESGKAVYEQNADELFAPASVTKLFTCAAALAEFGPDFRFRTPVYRRGELVEGTLKGDLILVAKGDPTLGGRTDTSGHLAFKNSDHVYATFTSTLPELTDTDPLGGLRELARQVRKSGVRKVEGDVLIDDRMFAPAFGSGSGPKIVTPIMVNDNLIDVVLTPAPTVGEPASARIRPENGFLSFDVQVETVAKDEKPNVTVELVGGPGRYVLRGKVPLGSKPLVRICPVPDPSYFARGLLIEALRREGVSVKASALARPETQLPEKDGYAGLTTVAHYESPPFSELVKVVLKVSHNLYASALPLLIAARHGKRTHVEGMELEGKILADLGLDLRDIALESGAGGGSCDRLTPRATVQLLRAMRRRPDAAAYCSAMPVLGVDGTLAGLLPKDSPAYGKVSAKTGTYLETDLVNDRPFLRCKSLAGVMTSQSGRNLVFAIFLNDVPLSRDADPTHAGKMLARICEAIYLHTP
jgi:D-alanyl-D-alanine carboxypeptidase/D-alanyl-D-alanine-endopeptidase (penicillin-binding protein 4)